MQKETFYRSFLPLLSSDEKMFHFFLDPRGIRLSDITFSLMNRDVIVISVTESAVTSFVGIIKKEKILSRKCFTFFWILGQTLSQMSLSI